jgi:hypothetical protein
MEFLIKGFIIRCVLLNSSNNEKVVTEVKKMSKIKEIELNYKNGFSTLTGVVGAYLGYRMGVDLVDLVNATSPNITDGIGYIINQHPFLTKMVAVLGTYELGTIPGYVIGSLADALSEYQSNRIGE